LPALVFGVASIRSYISGEFLSPPVKRFCFLLRSWPCRIITCGFLRTRAGIPRSSSGHSCRRFFCCAESNPGTAAPTSLTPWARHWECAHLTMVFLMIGGLILLFCAPLVMQVQNFFLHRASSMRAVSTPRWALWETLRVLILGLGTKNVLVGAVQVLACGAWGSFKQSRLIFTLLALPGMVDALGALPARGTMYRCF